MTGAWVKPSHEIDALAASLVPPISIVATFGSKRSRARVYLTGSRHRMRRRCNDSVMQAWQLTTKFSRPSLTARTIFRSPTVVPQGCSIPGEIPPIPGGVWRATTLESFRGDTPDWDVLIDVGRKARIGSGARRVAAAIVRLSRGGSTPSCRANSTYRHVISCPMGSACRSPRAALSGSTPTRCFCRIRSDPTSRPAAALRAQ